MTKTSLRTADRTRKKAKSRKSREKVLTRRPKVASYMAARKASRKKPAPEPVAAVPKHPGIPDHGPYEAAFRKVLGIGDENLKFIDRYPFANATAAEMLGWLVGGALFPADLWGQIREQAEAVEALMDRFLTDHADDLPDGFELSGEWTERVHDISTRLHAIAWLHHKTVQAMRMEQINRKAVAS